MRFQKTRFSWWMLDIAVLVLPLLLVSMDAFARAGGGSSGGSCHSWYCVLLYPIFMAYAAYVTLRISIKRRRVSVALKEMMKREPQWAEDKLLATAKDMFVRLQTAWGAQDLDTMRELLHPLLYPAWETDIKAQMVRGEKNILSGLSIKKMRIVDVQNYLDNERDEFTVAFDARANDQTFIENRQEKSSNELFREFWTFEWEQGKWALREVTQRDGWKRFVNAAVINQKGF